MIQLFKPDLWVTSVCDIPLDELSHRGIRGLLFDLDNTLLGHRRDQFDATVVDWLQHAKEAGFGVCIVSNGSPRRTLALADLLNVPGVAYSAKPRRRGLRRGLSLLGLPAPQVAMVGDQIFTDVLAGNRLGLFTILVDRYEPSEPWIVRIKRPFERLVLRSVPRASSQDERQPG